MSFLSWATGNQVTRGSVTNNNSIITTRSGENISATLPPTTGTIIPINIPVSIPVSIQNTTVRQARDVNGVLSIIAYVYPDGSVYQIPPIAYEQLQTRPSNRPGSQNITIREFRGPIFTPPAGSYVVIDLTSGSENVFNVAIKSPAESFNIVIRSGVINRDSAISYPILTVYNWSIPNSGGIVNILPGPGITLRGSGIITPGNAVVFSITSANTITRNYPFVLLKPL